MIGGMFYGSDTTLKNILFRYSDEPINVFEDEVISELVCDGEEIDVAINIMQQQLNSCNNCKHEERTSGAWLYCLNHGCYLKPDNLCRDWEREE